MVYLMKTKGDVLEKFDQYTGIVKVLRSDSGGEDFKEYLLKYDIGRQVIVPGTQQQKGVTERINQPA